MPEIVIKYKNQKTLEALRDFAKYLDFSIVSPKKHVSEKHYKINGVTIQKGNDLAQISDLQNVFTGKEIDSKELRKTSWDRSK